jgi:hypothetical protein
MRRSNYEETRGSFSSIGERRTKGNIGANLLQEILVARGRDIRGNLFLLLLLLMEAYSCIHPVHPA